MGLSLVRIAPPFNPVAPNGPLSYAPCTPMFNLALSYARCTRPDYVLHTLHPCLTQLLTTFSCVPCTPFRPGNSQQGSLLCALHRCVRLGYVLRVLDPTWLCLAHVAPMFDPTLNDFPLRVLYPSYARCTPIRPGFVLCMLHPHST
jgi:hypothetical protein